MRPLSDSCPLGSPQTATASEKISQVLSVVAVGTARQPVTSREWSSRKVRISTWPVAITHLVASACHSSLGAAASNRRHELVGRLRGWGTTNPRRTRIRQIVATDGTPRMPRRPRCHWIVAAPASSPASVSSLRSATTASSTSTGTRVGEVLGADERGSKPANPSSR